MTCTYYYLALFSRLYLHACPCSQTPTARTKKKEDTRTAGACFYFRLRTSSGRTLFLQACFPFLCDMPRGVNELKWSWAFCAPIHNYLLPKSWTKLCPSLLTKGKSIRARKLWRNRRTGELYHRCVLSWPYFSLLFIDCAASSTSTVLFGSIDFVFVHTMQKSLKQKLAHHPVKWFGDWWSYSISYFHRAIQ